MYDVNIFLRVSLLAFILTGVLTTSGQSKDQDKKKLIMEINEGICYFNKIKIGDQSDQIEKILGSSLLHSKPDNNGWSDVFYPEYGLKLSFQGKYVRTIALYPQASSSMGELSKFRIFSRNQYEWSIQNRSVNTAQPQDIMQTLGVENINPKIGGNFISGGGNAMGFRIVNSGGSQEIIFYFNKDYTLQHMVNRLGK